jgi:hypothetical protein
MVSYVLPFVMVEVREYLDMGGRSPFAASSDVAAALARIQQGNFSNAKGVGAGVTSTGLILVRATAFTSAKKASCL